MPFGRKLGMSRRKWMDSSLRDGGRRLKSPGQSRERTLSAALSVNNTFQWLFVDARELQGVWWFGGGTGRSRRLVFLSDGRLFCPKRLKHFSDRFLVKCVCSAVGLLAGNVF